MAMATDGMGLPTAWWAWLTPVLLMACTSLREVPRTPIDSLDAGATDGRTLTDAGSTVIDAGSGTPDVKRDASVGIDTAAPDTGTTACGANAHLCSGQCVSTTDVAHCGPSCSPCAAPVGGTATCDGTSCGATCPSGTKLCGTACVAQAMSCGGTCGAGSHDCSGICQPNTAIASCGSACTPCSPPAHGVASCDGAQCGFTCALGYHACGTQCVSSADVASCGSSCAPCATPTGGTATCDGASCGGTCPTGTKLCAGACSPTAQACLGSCPPGTHNCNGNCQSNTSPNSCGATSCTPCVTPANGVATCDGTQCGFTCSIGYHLCGGSCVANSNVASCGTTSCAACAPPPNATANCDGLQCGFQCGVGFHVCGSNCVANNNVQTCGSLCSPCAVPTNGTATCNGTSCAIACNDGFHNCGGLCVSNTSVLTCGSSCVACAVPPNGTATCDGTACGANIPSFRLTVSTAGIVGATGTVTPSPAGTSCGAGCVTFTPGQSVTITAAPTGASIFGGWSGDCAGQGAACTLVMSADHTAVAHFRPKMNIAFVTDGTLIPGTIGSSLATADAFCASSAKAAFLGGTVWKAWLSTSAATTNINAATHVGASTTGWIRIDGRPFATSMAALQAGTIYYPLKLTELGNDRSQAYAVMSSTNGDGSVIPEGTCADWTASTGSVYCGTAVDTTLSWSFQFVLGGDSCGTATLPIYCFENDTGMTAVPAPVAPANGRHAFLSLTQWTPGGGAAAADAVCQADASTAGLANAANYRALLTTTVPATDASRISLTGQPWYRLDGAQLVAVAADLADPAGGKMLTSLNLDTARVYAPQFGAWTGSGVAASSTAMTMNCSNWTSSSPTLMAWWGGVNISSSYWWAGNSNQSCGTPDHLYCFER